MCNNAQMGEWMNYEDFYQDLLPQQKNVKDGLAALQKLFKAVNREVEGGDVKHLCRKFPALKISFRIKPVC